MLPIVRLKSTITNKFKIPYSTSWISPQYFICHRFHLQSSQLKLHANRKPHSLHHAWKPKPGGCFPRNGMDWWTPRTHTHTHTHISKGCSSTCPGCEPREAPVKSHGLYREVCKGSEEAMERKSLPLWGGHGEEEARQGQMLFSQQWDLAQIIMQIFLKQHLWEHESWHCKILTADHSTAERY